MVIISKNRGNIFHDFKFDMCANKRKLKQNLNKTNKMMKHIKFLTLIFVTFTSLIACKKDDDKQVNQLLANSVWYSAIEANNVQTIVEFSDSENAIYSVFDKSDGTNRIISKIEYSYTFNAPNITLMPKTFVDHRLRGRITKHNEDCEYLYLKSDVDSLELFLTKSDVDIKIEVDSTEHNRIK